MAKHIWFSRQFMMMDLHWKKNDFFLQETFKIYKLEIISKSHFFQHHVFERVTSVQALEKYTKRSYNEPI